MLAPFSELFRIDPLTGCNNYLGFLETLVRNSMPGTSTGARPRGYGRKEEINASVYSAILFADMIDIDILNKTKGHAYADSARRWMGILLQEESGSEVYRLGGDEFAVLLKLETRDAHLELVDRILKRMELQARQFGFPQACAALFNKIGPAVFVTHSQGGGLGWATVLKTGNVRGIVAYEPGSGFLFPEGEVPETLPSSGGARGHRRAHGRVHETH